MTKDSEIVKRLKGVRAELRAILDLAEKEVPGQHDLPGLSVVPRKPKSKRETQFDWDVCTWKYISTEYLASLQTAYPFLNVTEELTRAAAVVAGNPKKYRQRKYWGKFINAWMKYRYEDMKADGHQEPDEAMADLERKIG